MQISCWKVTNKRLPNVTFYVTGDTAVQALEEAKRLCSVVHRNSDWNVTVTGFIERD